jgi:signal transduction histidine kinase
VEAWPVRRKELGKGTGLGLSITYRIVVETRKGHIKFLFNER